MEEKQNTHGGKREGAGRPKTMAKTVSFCATQEVVEILSNLEGNKSKFICEAIRQYANRNK